MSMDHILKGHSGCSRVSDREALQGLLRAIIYVESDSAFSVHQIQNLWDVISIIRKRVNVKHVPRSEVNSRFHSWSASINECEAIIKNDRSTAIHDSTPESQTNGRETVIYEGTHEKRTSDLCISSERDSCEVQNLDDSDDTDEYTNKSPDELDMLHSGNLDKQTETRESLVDEPTEPLKAHELEDTPKSSGQIANSTDPVISMLETQNKFELSENSYRRSSDNGASDLDIDYVASPFGVSDYDLKCSVCNKTFKASCDLKRHMHVHEHKERKGCPQCGKFFTGDFCLKKHIEMVHSSKILDIKCLVCDEKFTKSGDLHNHLRKLRHYKCVICGEGHSSKESLITHIDTHNCGEIHCNLCGESFISARAYVVHNKIHTGEGLHKCSDCSKEFSTRLSLICHMRVHMKVRPHQCPTCGNTFKIATDLLKHQQHAHGERKFLCVICGKKFSSKAALRKHSRTHSDARPYKCSHCEKTYRHLSGMNEHIRIHHTNQAGAQCPICGKTLQGHKLSLHIRTHTGEKPFVCKDCGKGFSQKNNLRTHTRIHTGEKPFACGICSASFSHNVSLKTHMHKHDNQAKS